MFAIVSEGVVVNLIVWDGDTKAWSAPGGSEIVAVPSGTAIDIGYAYSAGQLNAPAQ